MMIISLWWLECFQCFSLFGYRLISVCVSAVFWTFNEHGLVCCTVFHKYQILKDRTMCIQMHLYSLLLLVKYSMGSWFLNYMLMFVLFCIFGMNIPKTLWKRNWYIYYSLYSREWFHSIPFFSEKDFNVQTCIIALDFNSGRDVYPTIWEKIKDKEIGILGKNVFRTLLKHILCIDLLKRRRTVMPLLVCQLIDPSLSTPKMILIKKIQPWSFMQNFALYN